jgi:superfamily II helicase
MVKKEMTILQIGNKFICGHPNFNNKEKIMGNGLIKKLIILVLLFGTVAFPMIGQDRLSYAQNTKEVSGLRFQVPEDWPVEKRGGVLGPIPTEEYVSIKFKEADKEVQAIKDELSDKINDIQTQLDKMELELIKEMKNAQDQNVTSESGGQDMTDILVRLDEVESQLGRLDRKLTNKLLEIQKEFETTNMQLKSVEEDLGGSAKRPSKLQK